MTDKPENLNADESKESALSGPTELIARLVDGRTSGRRSTSELYGDISDEGVKRLLLLCYHASQAEEEGRYPIFRVYVRPTRGNLPPNLHDPWQLLQLGQPVNLTSVDDVRRLAPAASSHDYALEVREDDNAARSLSCVGIRMAHSGEGGTKILGTSIWARLVRPGLMIRVDGPGRLRVSEARRAFDLRAGRLADLGSLPTLALARWEDALVARLSPAEGDEATRIMFHTLAFAWHELLRSTSVRRHGGCFVVLPSTEIDQGDVLDKYGIRLKYPTANIGLGKCIAEFVAVCLQEKNDLLLDGYKKLGNEWMQKRHYLLTLIECLSTLSGVDGCTVFDGNLRLLGFGGKIERKEPLPGRTFKDSLSQKVLDQVELSQTGTRHLSAFHLCNAAVRVAAYVISQDGQATVFWSDEKTLWKRKDYPTWIKPSDHF